MQVIVPQLLGLHLSRCIGITSNSSGNSSRQRVVGSLISNEHIECTTIGVNQRTVAVYSKYAETDNVTICARISNLQRDALSSSYVLVQALNLIALPSVNLRRLRLNSILLIENNIQRVTSNEVTPLRVSLEVSNREGLVQTNSQHGLPPTHVVHCTTNAIPNVIIILVVLTIVILNRLGSRSRIELVRGQPLKFPVVTTVIVVAIFTKNRMTITRTSITVVDIVN